MSKLWIHIDIVSNGGGGYDATAMQSLDGGNTWTPVLRDDELDIPLARSATDRDRARELMVDSLVNKFPDDGFELVEFETNT